MFRKRFEEWMFRYDDKIFDLSNRVRKLERKWIEENECQETGVWKPENKEEYWYIGYLGDAYNDIWKDCIEDNYFFSIGNVFRTKEEAEFQAEHLKVIAELKQFTCKYSSIRENWLISYDIRKRRVTFICSNSHRDFGLYFESVEIGKKAVNTVGEDRIKKYLFEVEE